MKNFVQGGPNVPQAGNNNPGGGFGRSLASLALGFMGTRNRMLEQQQRHINELALHMSKREVTDEADKDMGQHWITSAYAADQQRQEAGLPGVRSVSSKGFHAQTSYTGNTPDPNKDKTPPTPGKGNPGTASPTGKRSKPGTIKDVESAVALSGSKRKLPKKAQLSDTYEINGKKVTEQPGTAPRLGIDSEAGANISPNYAKKLGRKKAAEDATNTGGPKVTPPKVTKPKTPKAPKGGQA
jgi:hypothetical protein